MVKAMEIIFLISTTSHAQGTQASHCARHNIDSNCRGHSKLHLGWKKQLANVLSASEVDMWKLLLWPLEIELLFLSTLARRPGQHLATLLDLRFLGRYAFLATGGDFWFTTTGGRLGFRFRLFLLLLYRRKRLSSCRTLIALSRRFRQMTFFSHYIFWCSCICIISWYRRHKWWSFA